MDKAISNRKDVFTINCREIPETLSVETRFLTLAAAKQKKYEQLLYLIDKDGQLELTNNEDQYIAFRNLKNPSKSTTITVSSQPLAPIMPQPVAVQQPPIPPAVAPLPALSMVRPISINSLLKSNASTIINAVPLPRITAVTTTSAAQMPIINLTANNMQANQVVPPITISDKCSLKDIMQQTEISAFKMTSVGIQCQLEEEVEDLEINWPNSLDGLSDNMETDEPEIENFLKFVHENSTQYKNSLRECLICGEISKSNKYFFSHMAIHQGSKVLCFKCGFSFHNEDLLQKHNCLKTKLMNKIYLKCPHYRCRVTAISKLELYDHLNEHNNYRQYKCTGCRKAFFTRQEFLRHILIRAKCYTQAKHKRYRIYNLENHKDRLCRVRVFTLHSFKKRTVLVTQYLSRHIRKYSECKICMRSITNAALFKSHHAKCVKKFRKRLMRKKYGKLST